MAGARDADVKTNGRRRIRARRYDVHTPVRYRTDSNENWHSAETKNVSRSGVLLRTDELLDLDMPIELILDLPTVITGEPAATVLCHGRVVRVGHATDERPLVAAEFSSYRFVRGSSD
ncbi:MAG TPA: PilZ domain-containing protein [Vicinamibacterales bacterium]|nr:PilZ domain-containing protein [Vicinamibacterales bacterium]